MKHVKQFSKYGTVAVGSAASDWIVFTTLVMGLGVYPLYGQMTSRIAGGVFSFVANKYWSFGSRDGRHLINEGRRFLILYAFSYALSSILFFALSSLLDVLPFFAKLATDTSIFIINYIVMNVYVFHGGFSLIGRVYGRLRRTPSDSPLPERSST